MSLKRVTDMHIHTYMSDGHQSPEDIIRKAKLTNTRILALTDHQSEYFNPAMAALCKYEDIAFIPGMECEAVFEGHGYHIHAYCCRPNDVDITDLLQRVRKSFKQRNREILAHLASQGYDVSFEECEAFTCNGRAGGWRLRQYLVSKGMATDSIDALKWQAGVPAVTPYNFPQLEELTNAIHRAGGRAVVAHPMKNVPWKGDLQVYADTLHKMMDAGLDGVETYYPGHTPEIIAENLKVCRDRNKLITTGCDCHSDLGPQVGSLGITEDMLNLGDLLEWELESNL